MRCALRGVIRSSNIWRFVMQLLTTCRIADNVAFSDANILEKTGKIWMTSDIADEYKFCDVTGKFFNKSL